MPPRPKQERVRGRRIARPPDQLSSPQVAQDRRPLPLPAKSITGVVETEHGGSGTGTTFPQGSVIFAGAGGVYAADTVFQFDATNKRLGLGIAVPTVRLDIVNNALAATLTPSLRLANETPSTSGAPIQVSPAIVYSGHAWDTDGAGTDRQVRVAVYLKTVSGSTAQSVLTYATDENGAGSFTEQFAMGTVTSGDTTRFAIRDGNLVFRNAGRGISFVTAPLTDPTDSNFMIAGDVSGGRHRIKFTSVNGYTFIEGNNFGAGAGVVPMMDFRGFDDSTSSPIVQIRLRGTPGGAVANGFGSRILAQANSSTTADQDQGAISIVWRDITHATRSADFVVSLVASAAAIAEKFRMMSTGLLSFGGITSSQPALKPSSAELQARLADDSAYAAFRALRLTVRDDDRVAWDARSRITSPADGRLLITNDAADNFTRLMLGGTSSSFVALSRNNAVLEAKLADDSDFAEFKARYLRVSDAAFVVRSSATWTDGAGAAVGTLNNSPAAGDASKWILFDDNGVTLAVPAWVVP